METGDKPVFRVGVAGLGARELRLIDVVFRHSRYNRYAFRLADAACGEDCDIVISGDAPPSGRREIDSARANGSRPPVIEALPRGSSGPADGAGHAIAIERLPLQLLPVLNRVVEQELLNAAPAVDDEHVAAALPDAAAQEHADEPGGEHAPADALDDARGPNAVEPTVTALVATGEPPEAQASEELPHETSSAELSSADASTAETPGADASKLEGPSSEPSRVESVDEENRGDERLGEERSGDEQLGDGQLGGERFAEEHPVDERPSAVHPAESRLAEERLAEERLNEEHLNEEHLNEAQSGAEPSFEETLPGPAARSVGEHTTGPGLRVLVVDDSPTVRRQLTVAFDRLGLACETVDSAGRALERLADEHFDLALVDVVMPDWDGYKLTREIKRNKRLRQMPVIILTSRSSPFDLARGALSGCDAYLTKPVPFRALESAVVKQFRRSIGAEELARMMRVSDSEALRMDQKPESRVARLFRR